MHNKTMQPNNNQSGVNLKNIFISIKEDILMSFNVSVFVVFLSIFIVFSSREFNENDEQLTVSTFMNNHLYTAAVVVSLTATYLGKSWTCLLYVTDPSGLKVLQTLEFIFWLLSLVLVYEGETKTLHVIAVVCGSFTSFLWHALLYALGTSYHHRVWLMITTIVLLWLAVDTLISLTAKHNYYLFFVAEIMGMLLNYYGNFIILSNKFRIE